MGHICEGNGHYIKVGRYTTAPDQKAEDLLGLLHVQALDALALPSREVQLHHLHCLGLISLQCRGRGGLRSIRQGEGKRRIGVHQAWEGARGKGIDRFACTEMATLETHKSPTARFDQHRLHTRNLTISCTSCSHPLNESLMSILVFLPPMGAMALRTRASCSLRNFHCLKVDASFLPVTTDSLERACVCRMRSCTMGANGRSYQRLRRALRRACPCARRLEL